jgi:hypothetical protein
MLRINYEIVLYLMLSIGNFFYQIVKVRNNTDVNIEHNNIIYEEIGGGEMGTQELVSTPNLF